MKRLSECDKQNDKEMISEQGANSKESGCGCGRAFALRKEVGLRVRDAVEAEIAHVLRALAVLRASSSAKLVLGKLPQLS
jgi:hypothetical protein